MTFFWSEIGSGFEEPGGTPPPRIPRSNPPPGPFVSPKVSSKNLVLIGSKLPNSVCRTKRLRVIE